MSGWRKLTAIEVGSSWVWTLPILGSWFQFSISGEVEVEVAQGDGESLVGDAILLDGRSQSLYLPLPAVIEADDRRLAFRTSEAVKFQAGWTVTVFVPNSELPPPATVGSDPAVLTTLQTLLIGQTAISTRLDQPIEAVIDPALTTNVQALLTGQAEILDQFPLTVSTDPAIVSSLQTLQTGQQQILSQFPVTVQSDPAIVSSLQTLQTGQQQIFSLLQSPVILVFFGFGDRGGVFYFLGSNRLQQNWVNPLTTGAIVTQVSSLANGTLQTPTDRQQGAFWYTNNTPGQWLSFDFKTCRVAPTYYTIQHSAETGYYLRNWKLQGSNNGTTWTDLDVRTANTTINAVNAWGGFAVTGAGAYRYLRILSTGVEANNGNYLVIGEIEFYGQLSVGQ